MVFCYGNAWTTSSTTSSTGILWMGSGGGGGATTTCTSTATSDCYMWVGDSQRLNLQQTQLEQVQQLNQMQAAALNQYYYQDRVRQGQSQVQQQALTNQEAQRISQEIEQQRKAEQQRTQPARDRAKELLLSNLTPAQKETLEKNKWFIVEGGRSKQRYRIRVGLTQSGNIDVMDGEQVRHKLCAHLNPTIGIPLDDHFLAQKLMLEAAEDDFLRTANVHRV